MANGELAFLTNTMPYVKQAIEDMQKATINRALGLIRSKQLTADVALALWMEIWSAHEVETRLNKRVSMPAFTQQKDGE